MQAAAAVLASAVEGARAATTSRGAATPPNQRAYLAQRRLEDLPSLDELLPIARHCPTARASATNCEKKSVGECRHCRSGCRLLALATPTAFAHPKANAVTEEHNQRPATYSGFPPACAQAPSVRLSVCLSFFLSASVCLSVCLCVCVSVCLSTSAITTSGIDYLVPTWRSLLRRSTSARSSSAVAWSSEAEATLPTKRTKNGEQSEHKPITAARKTHTHTCTTMNQQFSTWAASDAQTPQAR